MENSLNYLDFYINNHFKRIYEIDPRKTLLEYLRETGYKGTKYGCGEGGCGACTVVIAETASNQADRSLIKYRSANACLIPLCLLNRKQIITIEGIGNPDEPHPIQERMAKGHGTQCGFCTPGIVMALYGFLKINPRPSVVDIEEALDGNLCRCTGYRPILDVAKSFCHDNSIKKLDKNNLVNFYEFKNYDTNMDVPFPTKLKNLALIKRMVCIKYGNLTWIEPTNLEELLNVKSTYPNAKLVGGNSEIGIEMRFKMAAYDSFINISNINELKNISVLEVDQKGLRKLNIGANVTLNELRNELEAFKNKGITKLHENCLIDSYLYILKWFASNQIRNFATLAGNISTGSPISDINPILMANNAILTILSEKNGVREVSIKKFFLGYRKIDLNPDEIIIGVSTLLPENNLEYVRSYKQAKRKSDDISIVNGCFRIKLVKENDNKFMIENLDLSFGGLSSITLYLESISKSTKGLIWNDTSTLTLIEDLILDELDLSYSSPGGMASYRRTLAVSFFTKFWRQSLKHFNLTSLINEDNSEVIIDSVYYNNIDDIQREASSGTQDFEDEAVQKEHALGLNNSHTSALKHSTGTARYLDDMPKQDGELHAGFVLSKKAHALIKNIDTSKALLVEGVHAFISYKDTNASNMFGVVDRDEEIFASSTVVYYGQLIGLIIADTKEKARLAANLVEIEYESLDSIFTIEDAIEKNSFFDKYERKIIKGEFSSKTFVPDENEVVFDGVCKIGGQEHFYLETQSCLVIPTGEDHELEIWSSTQDPSLLQSEISKVLGIAANKVVCNVKRLGGGFGGKETRGIQFCLASAIAAKKLNRPIRCIIDRDIDMMVTGNRHPFMGKYKLKVTKDGYFKACEADLYNNAGHSIDLSYSVMERAITHMDNVYNFPKIKLRGRMAKTNLPSNTAFRGFGSPQSLFIVETMISEVADQLGIDQNEIRLKNMYNQNDITYIGMPIEDWFVPEMFDEIYKIYDIKLTEIEDYNRNNKWKKRGISMLPIKHGIGYYPNFLNQAGALVHIYTDGTVLLNHSGVEMGQGLHTKMIQIAANALNVPIEDIHTVDTATNKVANSTATAASISSDLNGMAIYNACMELNKRLEPYKQRNPAGKLSNWAIEAYLDRVNLSAYGFYQIPDLNYDMETNTGRMYCYYTSGVGLSIVEIDVLTGDHVILQSELYMDIGRSINYAIDIGQIEGAFIQGIGLYTTEEVLILSSNGSVLTSGPGTYKIPTCRDIPVKFNIKLLKDKEYKHLKTIKSSKGVGEPPLLLAATVFFAIRNALKYARESNGNKEPVIGLPSPCTSEIIRLFCNDELVKKSMVSQKAQKPWSIRP